jgi:hypothetical protein
MQHDLIEVVAETRAARSIEAEQAGSPAKPPRKLSAEVSSNQAQKRSA